MMKKRLLCLILSVLLIGSLLPISAFAVAFHNTENSYSLDCSEHTVTVTASGDYQTGYLLVRLCNAGGTIVQQKAASAKNPISLSTAALANGLYYVELFTGTSPTGSYVSYASGKSTMQIEVTGGVPSNVISDTWIYNLGLYTPNRTDSFALSYYKTAAKSTQLKKLAAKITESCTTDYQKILAVHDWITSNIGYDYDHEDSTIPTDADSVYTLRYTNAKGYANLTAELLRQAGVAAKVVSGYVQTGDTPLSTDHKGAEQHFWNEAYDTAAKRWIILDTCWDSANVYENGKLSLTEGYSRYFDPTLEAFSVDHLLDQNEDTASLKSAFTAAAKEAEVTYSRTTLYTGSVNHTGQITVTLPSTLKDAKVTYSSSKTSVVSVSKAGKLTGKKAGSSTITVKISDGTNSYSFKQTVKVYDPFLKYSASVSSLKVGKSYTFAVKKYGVSGTVKWSVSDKTIATISSKGKLTAKKAGTVTVTATVNGVKKSVKVKITK